MKNQLLTAVCSGLASVFLSVSCSNDNCSLKEQMNDLDSRVAKLEEMCSEMNTNINALQTLVNALQNKEFIESVSLLPDGEGYSVVFSSGKTIALYNGTAPIIGVKQDIDGSWYWTLDGDWLYADGAKICASSKTPQLKIENGQWFISYDGGKTWQESGKASGDDAGIISITQDEDYVHFEMQDGTVITIAKYHPLSIQFDTDDVAITNGGEKKTIGYTLGGASESVIVKAIAQDGWKVKVETVSSTSGTIEITSPDPITESEILVFVNDNGRTVLAVLNCVKSTIIISQEQFNVPSIGGRIEVRTESNMDYNIVIPEEAQAWLSLEQTKAMSSRSFCLIASKNQNPYDRCTTVSLTDKNGTVIRTFVVLQYADPSGLVCIAVDNAGELHSKMKSFDKSKITALKILGVLNDVDFLDIYYEMPSLKYLDISEVDIERLPEGCFRSLKTIETYILPNTLVEIQDNCFSDSSISGNLIIPASCTLIGDEAFKNCGSLTSVIIPASCETIGMYAFYTCNSLENVIFEPNSKLRSISMYSFSQTALKEIVIPASCELIVDYAFQLCKSLETVNFEPNSKLTEIRSSCFSKTPLKDITIPASCKIIGAEVFADCAYLEKIEFEPGSELEIIGETDKYNSSTFSNCESLKAITIPDSCKEIAGNTFSGCSALESIVFSSDSQIQILQDNTFNDCISLTSIHIPASITDIRYGCFNGCISLTDISFENNSKLESIGGSCFYGCTQIHRIQMQNCTNLKEIGSGAFLSSDLIYYMQIGTTTPPDLGGNDVFGNVGTYSVLKVPAGSESSYRNKQGWNEFSSITSL